MLVSRPFWAGFIEINHRKYIENSWQILIRRPPLEPFWLNISTLRTSGLRLSEVLYEGHGGRIGNVFAKSWPGIGLYSS